MEMRTKITREQALETVGISPAAVAAHDKEAWVGLFAGLSAIEDPFGSRPHLGGVFDARSGTRGDAALGRFYETFIAPNRIEFHVDTDIVCGTHVVRDLEVEITMAPSVVVRVPMHLLYEVCEDEGELKIRHLAAYWELVPMIRRLMSTGPAAWPVGMALGRRMARNLGLAGTAGFVAGARTVGEAGKRAVVELADATNRGDRAGAARLFVDGGPCIEAPHGEAVLSPEEFVAGGAPRLAVGKLLACGPTVSASVDVETATGHRDGVGLFDFDLRSRRLHRVRLYWEA